ncbi:uncharacterized protein K452DRAFT_123291 [Aplosporella prunicola CBS 121167]|uniref:Uncharacterized protein n=1 Tax=Aplosporella prunicola CBS 121167 TaxID=1176127 RepID=A0A6A6BQR3_9PEZI|nr:uncharacterized protein K452DRAFT_123291 [Aplosporella prunicola CBS 121167]KAF2145645.1 hypothetical protein K452DRAFT_123291 [Aplosporella prunicola CBS 121167]
MDPLVSWGLFIIVGSAAVLYYRSTNEKKTQARGLRAKSVSDDIVSRTKSKRKTDVITSGSDTAAKKKNDVKARNKKKDQQAPSKAPQVTTQPIADEEDDNDKEWARQLADLKKGTTLAPPTRKEGRGKTVKQRAADADRGLTSGSSNNGAEADGELSPALSPAMNATAPSGNDIADMLEAPAAGPSVLRLTESTKPVKQQQAKKAPAEAKETKKQRQNRRKVEEARAANEETEKARRALLEKQLRTAREARGEPAKNGVASVPSGPNPWTAQGAPVTSAPAAEAPLLDTLDNERQLPTEEEQMRLAMEDSGWNTVEKGKKGKKKPADDSLAVKQVSEAPAKPVEETAKSSPNSTPKTSPKVRPAEPHPTNSFSALDDLSSWQGHPQDSDWAVL